MTAPYRNALQAIRAALSIDARSLYNPASWQSLAGSGYRESSLRGDLTKIEIFQQACLTLRRLHWNMPPHLWALLIIRYSPPLSRDGVVLAGKAELDRMCVAVEIVAGNLKTDRREFAQWAVAHWGKRLPQGKAQWDHWQNRDSGAISTLKRLYSRDVKPALGAMERTAMATAENVLKHAGMIESEAA